MRIVALISASQGTASFPDKLLAVANDKTIIQHTYQSVVDAGLFTDVIVVTNSDLIEEQVKALGGNAVKTVKQFDNHIESLAEAAILIDADIFVCIPGDHIKLYKPAVEKMLQYFDGVYGKDIKAASIVRKIQDESRITDANTVKVALNLRMYSLYFSRCAIPYVKKSEIGFAHYEHVNILACRKEVLLNTTQQPSSPLERAEGIDCLRLIENGVQIKMTISPYPLIDIHTEADMAGVATFINN